MNENGSNPFITNASNQKNGDFEFVDYKGNYGYDAPNFVQASNKAVHTVVSIKNYSNQRQQQQQQMFDPFDFFFGQFGDNLQLSQTKVEYFYQAMFVYHDVRWFNITMNNTCFMSFT